MEEVFDWLQRTLLRMMDSEEAAFIDLGRKLLTVNKYVVVNATTEAEVSRAFWAEATELTIRGNSAAELVAGGGGDVDAGPGVGGGRDPREDSVLLVLPGFRFNVSAFGGGPSARHRLVFLRVRLSTSPRWSGR